MFTHSNATGKLLQPVCQYGITSVAVFQLFLTRTTRLPFAKHMQQFLGFTTPSLSGHKATLSFVLSIHPCEEKAFHNLGISHLGDVWHSNTTCLLWFIFSDYNVID